MKKVKFLLFGVIILSAIGGAFALKASRRSVAFCTTAMLNGACPNRLCGVSTTRGELVGGPNNICYSSFAGSNCNVLCPNAGRTLPE